VTAPTQAAHRAPEGSPFLAHHFPDMGAQLETAQLGVWIFLASEVLFFGGLFTAYAVFRGNHPELFRYAHHFLDWRLGALNTAVLIGSSLSAAWAVRCVQLGRRRGLEVAVLVTVALAATFMVVKVLEYSHKLNHGVGWGPACRPDAEILATLPQTARALAVPRQLGTFFGIYYMMTGLHGIHVLVGIGLFVWILRRARAGHFGPGYFGPVDAVALYWHLVDLVWIYLFPLFYLI
jgi:cytochrome c oxidase subunit 3